VSGEGIAPPVGERERARARRVAFVAPSGYLPDLDVADRAARLFVDRGWTVSAGDTVFSRQQRFAGPDDLRAEELQRFATDRRLDVVVAARGGYGLSRLLPRLDFDTIAQSGTILVGYSDFTAFALALLAKTGGMSLQGPAAGDFAAFGSPGADGFTVRHFFEAIGQEQVSIRFDSDAPDLDVRGRLWGGNLAMTCALLGTPYFPRIRGGILFLEDVNEPAYRIERMLLQLEQAGVLARQKAIVLGDFVPMPAMPNDNGFDLGAVVAHLRSMLDIPLITGLPFGHGSRRVTLPVGAPGRLQIRSGQAELQFSGHPALSAGRRRR
jgi:muramoyltetrapeptide carboxypeptidase